MVVLPRRRAPRLGTGRNNPYEDPAPPLLGSYPPPHGHPQYYGGTRWFSPQIVLVLIAGMGIGYVVLPNLTTDTNSARIGFEDVVKRMEAERGGRASYAAMMDNAAGAEFGRVASAGAAMGGASPSSGDALAVSSPMNMISHSRRDRADALLRGDVSSRRRTSQDAGSDGGESQGHKMNEEHESAADAAVDAAVNAAVDAEGRPASDVKAVDPAAAAVQFPNHRPIRIPDEPEIHSVEVQRQFVENQRLLASQSIPTSTNPLVMYTPTLSGGRQKKILVTGGAGFVGSHLVDKLMMEGHEVIVLDNFFTGQRKNVDHWMHHPRFSLIVHDVTEPIMLEVDEIYHLACPASPPHYQYNPVKTIKTSTMGTINMLGLAKRVKAKILLTSTSEVYGDPKVHPQPESYWGNVNTIGPRSCYDEGKRVAETMMYSYRNQNKVDVRVARIFNTFGPRMHPNDGRVVSNFIIQALQDKPLTIYGDGSQTRSFQYVSDLVNGLHALMNGNYDLPVNLGNPDEYTVKEFAQNIKEMTKSESNIEMYPKPEDDPTQRKPDISTAKREINWQPQVTVKEGLQKTIAYFSRVLDESGEIIPTGQKATKPKPKTTD